MDIVTNNSLIQVIEEEPRVSHYVIAEQTENGEKAIRNNITKFASDFKEFGTVHFKNAPRKDLNRGGDKPKEYFLNEQQATLLLTYLRNTEIVRNFKITLVKAFFQMREQQQNKPLSFEELAKQTILLAEERIQKLESKIEKQKPLVTYAETVSTAINGITIREWVGAMKQENGLQVGERKVINFLLDNKHLYRDKKNSLRPYSNQFDFFSLEPIVIGTKYGNKERLALKVTGRGQTVLTEKVIAHFSEKDAA
jgi:anti-repressor protein